MTRRAPLFDRAIATGYFDLPSRYFVAHPNSRITKKIVGDNPARWHAVRTHADEVREVEWLRFDGDPDAGLYPASFVNGALVAAPVSEVGRAVAELEREYGGVAVPAAAFRVGKAIVAAEIPPYKGNRLTLSEDVPGHYTAILGVGGSALYATVGALHVEAGEFAGAEMVISRAASLQALTVEYAATPRL